MIYRGVDEVTGKGNSRNPLQSNHLKNDIVLRCSQLVLIYMYSKGIGVLDPP